MAMRKVDPNDLIGKTIEKVDAQAVNVLTLTFTDGTEVQLWAEDAVHTQYGNVPGIFINDESLGRPMPSGTRRAKGSAAA